MNLSTLKKPTNAKKSASTCTFSPDSWEDSHSVTRSRRAAHRQKMKPRCATTSFPFHIRNRKEVKDAYVYVESDIGVVDLVHKILEVERKIHRSVRCYREGGTSSGINLAKLLASKTSNKSTSEKGRGDGTLRKT